MTTKRIDKLGTRLDGWADLIDGAGSHAERVRAQFNGLMFSRRIPNFDMDKCDMLPNAFPSGDKRTYFVSNLHGFGVTIPVYIGAIGKDLYVNWDVFIKPILNPFVIGGIFALSAFLALPALDQNLMLWFLCAITVGGFLSLLVLIAGKVYKNNSMEFFFIQIDHFVANDITAIMLAVHHSLLQSLDMVGIDRSILREKKQFYAGQRDRLI